MVGVIKYRKIRRARTPPGTCRATRSASRGSTPRRGRRRRRTPRSRIECPWGSCCLNFAVADNFPALEPRPPAARTPLGWRSVRRGGPRQQRWTRKRCARDTSRSGAARGCKKSRRAAQNRCARPDSTRPMLPRLNSASSLGRILPRAAASPVSALASLSTLTEKRAHRSPSRSTSGPAAATEGPSPNLSERAAIALVTG